MYQDSFDAFQLYSQTDKSMSQTSFIFKCQGDYYRQVYSLSDHFEVFLSHYIYFYDPYYIYGRQSFKQLSKPIDAAGTKVDHSLGDEVEFEEDREDSEENPSYKCITWKSD